MRMLTLFLALIGAAGLPLAAAADGRCLPAEQMLGRLQAVHGETPVWIGLTDSSTRLVITGTPDGRGFSVLALDGTGSACMLAAGIAWAQVDLQPAGIEH